MLFFNRRWNYQNLLKKSYKFLTSDLHLDFIDFSFISYHLFFIHTFWFSMPEGTWQFGLPMFNCARRAFPVPSFASSTPQLRWLPVGRGRAWNAWRGMLQNTTKSHCLEAKNKRKRGATGNQAEADGTVEKYSRNHYRLLRTPGLPCSVCS